MDDYLKLLDYLEEWGIDRLVQVDHLLHEWFKKQPNVDPNEPPDVISDRIAHFVDEMHESKHIRLEKHRQNEDGSGLWEVRARLTSGGLEYLNNYRLVQSNLNLNKSTITSNNIISANSKRQTWILGVVGFFALVSMVVSIMTYRLDNQTKQLSVHIKQLQQDSLKLQKELFQLKMPHTKKN
jgi:hypothetical protein